MPSALSTSLALGLADAALLAGTAAGPGDPQPASPTAASPTAADTTALSLTALSLTALTLTAACAAPVIRSLIGLPALFLCCQQKRLPVPPDTPVR